MDEHTFQDELRQLKQRVSEMSLSSEQRQREHLEQTMRFPDLDEIDRWHETQVVITIRGSCTDEDDAKRKAEDSLG